MILPQCALERHAPKVVMPWFRLAINARESQRHTFRDNRGAFTAMYGGEQFATCALVFDE